MEPIELPDIQVEPAPEPRVFANLRAAGANNLAPPEVVQKAITDDDVDGYKEQEVRPRSHSRVCGSSFVLTSDIFPSRMFLSPFSLSRSR